MSAPDLTTDGQKAIWDEITKVGALSVHEIAQVTGYSNASVRRYLRKWVKEGHLERRERDGVTLWLRSNGVARPKSAAPQTPQEAMWRILRIRKAFDRNDLRLDLSQAGIEVSDSLMDGFIQTLLRAGYLKVEIRANQSRVARYRLARDTGPKPPKTARREIVIDDNTGDLMHVQGVEL
ncbi:DeoR family transcriptional regulator [Tropicimonas sp. S265A]|uniref:DeoR family transcriptional regulator n=1 Tax=Tropicimonas sp. S265A TaxID=3415134 RepID=UPI003C7C326D